MSSAAELIFNPDTDFKILEQFEFQEEIQRPETVRFFTFQEQSQDFKEKLIPKKGKISKAVVRKIEYEVDTFSKLYSRAVQETASGFAQKDYSPPTSLPWVHYQNSHPLQKTAYSWQQKWSALYTDANGLAPNFYHFLLDSLPKSALFFPEGDGIPVYVHGKTRINELVFLPNYTYTQTITHEDGRSDIRPTTREDTGDNVRFTDYRIDPPPLAPPNPRTDHPFLSLHPEPVVLKNTAPLPEILPNIDDILTHAVPETSDPYGKATPYLKIYDLTLKDVPNAQWVKKFPPVPRVDEAPLPIELSFPVGAEDAPSKLLLDTYGASWYAGLSPRKWLNAQVDGGALLANILLSKAGDMGPLAPPPPTILPEAAVIQGTPEDCLPSEITSFDDFMILGVFRPAKCPSCGAAGHPGPICPIKKVKTEYAPGHGCIPLTFIDRERADAVFEGKAPWLPQTKDELVKGHIDTMAGFKEYETDKFPKYPAADPASATNEIRVLIVSILDDDARAPEDQFSEISDLLKSVGAVVKNHLYLDKLTGAFLICEHEMERLQGDYDKNPRAFISKWCAPLDGYYVCQYSGERVADILESQNQYDESGHITNRRDAIQTGPVHKDVSHLTFAASLKDIQENFRPTEPGEDIMYLVITLLQVLPNEGPLLGMLGYVRDQSSDTVAKSAGKGVAKSTVETILASIGFAAIIVLMQTHRPQLVPRRSFGSGPVVLRGYPRDTDDINDAPLVDSLLNALREVFSEFPTTFKGASVSFVRSLLDSRAGVRKLVIAQLKRAKKTFAFELDQARAVLDSVAVGEELVQCFSPPILPPTKDVGFLKPAEVTSAVKETRFRCPGSFSWYSATSAFSFTQGDVHLETLVREPLRPVVAPPEEMEPHTPTAAEIGKRKKSPKYAPLDNFLKKADDNPSMLQELLLLSFRVISESGKSVGHDNEVMKYIRETRPLVTHAAGSPSLLRDYFKSVLGEFFALVSKNSVAKTKFEHAVANDMSLKSLLSSAAESRKHLDSLTARERETFKDRMRAMPDPQREITKALIDLGLAPYLITKADREGFVKELRAKIDDDAEPPTDNPYVAPGDVEQPEDVPEEGLHAERGVGDQGAEAEAEDGEQLPVDTGDYGDAQARTAEGEEYAEAAAFDYEEEF